ncbi:unnamed protein product [Ambrosiozyma monospora]|uniref:Unnamed protein product n=1 Tax=Ambrosiozyma monospora TaxID=43982 RepID=A0ACB5SXA8_AMBMO|nr:unnamed protein product [Ambrosiozyma monospora]
MSAKQAITLFAGVHSRDLVPRGIVKTFHLEKEVKVIENPDPVEYKKLFPQAKYPSLVGPNGYKLHEFIAVVMYLISLRKAEAEYLLGDNDLEQFQIMKWMSWGTTEFVNAYKPLNSIARGKTSNDAKVVVESYKNLKFQVEYLETALKERKFKYLVNDKVTLADLFATALFNRVFQFMHGAEWRDQHPVLMAWFKEVSSDPILSWFDFPLCDKPYPYKFE